MTSCLGADKIVCSLSQHFGKDIRLFWNNNRSSLLAFYPETGKLSLHRSFLSASSEVFQAIESYICLRRRSRRRQEALVVLKRYMSSYREDAPFPKKVAFQKIVYQGEVYDLLDIYHQLNQEYFSNTLNLSLTWFGKKNSTSKTSKILGKYCSVLRLVQISRLLDSLLIPEFLVHFVVYHEMLHAIIPGYVDVKGRFRMHGEQFKVKEREFRDYKRATNWLKKNKQYFFASLLEGGCGRS